MSGWTGMDAAIADLSGVTASDVDRALEATADRAVERVRADWPSKTGRSAAAWIAQGTRVVNPRPESSHIQAGRAAAHARDQLAQSIDIFEDELTQQMGLD